MNPWPIKPVLRFCGVAGRDIEDRQCAIDRLAAVWGSVVVRSPPLPFDGGGYYREAMGQPLQQELVAFGAPVQPDDLPRWKIDCVDLESEIAHEVVGDVARPVNLDCGYLTEAKFVLATTKNRSHRIYLRDAIFAEITLTYVGGRWRRNEQTYPNYRTAEVAQFADRCRVVLREHLHGED